MSHSMFKNNRNFQSSFVKGLSFRIINLKSNIYNFILIFFSVNSLFISTPHCKLSIVFNAV